MYTAIVKKSIGIFDSFIYLLLLIFLMSDEVKIYELSADGKSYEVFVQGNSLFRSEEDSIGRWYLYGGVNQNRDYDVVTKEGGYEGGCGRPYETFIVRKGDFNGKPISLEDIARKEVRVGDRLVVRPVASPRALKLGLFDICTLSGLVSAIRTSKGVLPNLVISHMRSYMREC